MDFINLPIIWENAGVKPPDSLLKDGFRAGYKPPAPYFNYIFNNYGNCIDELQAAFGKIKFDSGIIHKNITIPCSKWTENTNTETAYPFIAEVSVTEIQDTMIPILSIRPECLETAKVCEMCATAETIPGALRVYAGKRPETDISGGLTLISTGSAAGEGIGSGTGTGNYTLPIATATRLGGVKIGEGFSIASDGTISVDGTAVEEKIIPTPEEIQTVLDEIYSESGENQS